MDSVNNGLNQTSSTVEPFPLHCPASFGFSEQHLADIRSICLRYLKDQTLAINRQRKGTKISVVSVNGETQEYDFPKKVYFCYKDQELKVFVQAKDKQVGRGSERIVTLAHELVSNHPCVHKRVSNTYETQFLIKAMDLPSKRGLFLPLALNLASSKHKIVEEMGFPLLNNLYKLTNHHLKNCIEDLLLGLCTLHEMTLANQHYHIGDAQFTFERPKIAHQDIKLENMLIRKHPERKYEMGFIDFGGVSPMDCYFSCFFRSPHKIRYLRELNHLSNKVGMSWSALLPTFKLYNRNFAQKEDVWSLGIAFLSILSRGKAPFVHHHPQVPALNCFFNAYRSLVDIRSGLGQSAFRLPEDQFVCDIRQVDMDLSVDDFFNRHIPTELNPNCKMQDLIKKMLKVDPQQRYTSQQTLEAFRAFNNLI